MDKCTAYTKPLFYRGDMDDKTVTAENGARLNEDYNNLMLNGPWASVQMHRVRDGVYCLTGVYVANFTLVESDNGYILVDTGLNKYCALELLKYMREVTDKPVVAIIYSHNHYTGGARFIQEAFPDSNIPIYGHPGIHRNIFSEAEPGTLRHAIYRTMGQMGLFLPKNGPDANAVYNFTVPVTKEPALNQSGYLPVTHAVQDGENYVIDGVRVQFHHCVADANDSLISYFPDYDLVQHNAAIMPMMFPLYTLRGGEYRDAPGLIAGLDKLRQINPEHMIGCHGFPLSGKDKTYELATLHRDAYAFIYHQTLRCINQGMGPEELAQAVQLPADLAEDVRLFGAYIDVEFAVKGIYRGIIGWWANDTADIHPPTTAALSAVLVEGFGSVEAVVARAQKAFDAKEYDLALKLVSMALSVAPDNTEFKSVKARWCRHLAYTTRCGIQERNFYLTEALRLEGSVPTVLPGNPPLANMPVHTVRDANPAEFFRLLGRHLDPQGVETLTATLIFTFSDSGDSHGLGLRNATVEYLGITDVAGDIHIELSKETWSKVVVGQVTLNQAVEQGNAIISGDESKIKIIMNAFRGVFVK